MSGILCTLKLSALKVYFCNVNPGPIFNFDGGKPPTDYKLEITDILTLVDLVNTGPDLILTLNELKVKSLSELSL